MTGMLWTQEADSLLSQLWDAGCSLTCVAAEMRQQGYDVTRNAIAGRRWRLKLPLRNPAPPRPTKPSKKTVVVDHRTQRLRVLNGLKGRKLMCMIGDDGETNVVIEGVPYLEAPSWGCKAVLEKRGSDGLRMMCGRRRATDEYGRETPYCAHHFRLYNHSASLGRRTA